MTPELTPSKTLTRAVRVELDRLARAAARIDKRHAALRAELEELEQERVLLRRRDALLRKLGEQESAISPERAAVPNNGGTADEHEVLRGAQIREQAATLFFRRHGAGKALHYRHWLDLLTERGMEISGKDPAATFLTNLSRSPVVVRGEEPGTYAIDSAAPAGLRGRLSELNAELVDLASVVADQDHPPPDLLRHRADLLSEIRKTERLLAEAVRVLGAVEDDGLAEAA